MCGGWGWGGRTGVNLIHGMLGPRYFPHYLYGLFGISQPCQISGANLYIYSFHSFLPSFSSPLSPHFFISSFSFSPLFSFFFPFFSHFLTFFLHPFNAFSTFATLSSHNSFLLSFIPKRPTVFLSRRLIYLLGTGHLGVCIG